MAMKPGEQICQTVQCDGLDMPKTLKGLDKAIAVIEKQRKEVPGIINALKILHDLKRPAECKEVALVEDVKL